MDKHNLPFKVGQEIESRSFINGFRGAWFRSTIKKIEKHHGSLYYRLEYPDFPDEKILKTKVYQNPPTSSRKSKQINLQLMIRPPFPPIHRESQMPDPNTMSEVVVFVDDVWKIGDLVDWFSDNCYWSGTVTEILGDEKVRIELLPPPAGQGDSYEVLCRDLRPSLDWSPEHGWVVPNSMDDDNENHRCCARLIRPINTGNTDVQATAETSLKDNASFSSHLTACSLPSLGRSEKIAQRTLSITKSKEQQTAATNIGFNVDMEDNGIGKTSCSGSVSSSHIRYASGEMAGTITGKERCNGESLKRIRTDGSISLNSMLSDSLEAAILDLEELANRVKWLKGILQLGMPSSTTMHSTWKFLEHRASSTPK